MRLHEYQAKELFAGHGILVPAGDTVRAPEAVRGVAERMGTEVAIKAQVLVGGRGKAGGVAFAETPAEATEKARAILGRDLKGLPVHRVLVEKKVDAVDEIYVGLTVDRQAQCMVLIISSEGGVDIEETARRQPQKVQRIVLDPLIGLRPYHVTRLATAMGLPRSLWGELKRAASSMYELAQECETTLVEINPLVVSREGDLYAVDAKMTIDDGALFRHEDIAAMRQTSDESAGERRAREAGISYVKLEGDIGCMVNGAGLAMATMDVIKLYGGEPANFLDIGGGAGTDIVIEALGIILEDAAVRAVLINIFGGITRCDAVAEGIVQALDRLNVGVPLVVRLAGTNEEAGRRILREAGVETTPSLAEGARKAVVAVESGE
jgi:succinyl-CoA synthetase beta subunit